MKKTQFKIKQVPQILENFSKSSQNTDEQTSNQDSEIIQEEENIEQVIENEIELEQQTQPEIDSGSNQIDASNTVIEYHAFTRIPKNVALCDLNNNIGLSDQEIEQMLTNQNGTITKHEQSYMDGLVDALIIK